LPSLAILVQDELKVSLKILFEKRTAQVILIKFVELYSAYEKEGGIIASFGTSLYLRFGMGSMDR
jgi:hypothetical protein